jgi:HD superfamily phosphohydrolase
MESGMTNTVLPPGGRIADPVHGYVGFTGLERLLLDQPITQRLRYIMQNGLAHLVFPEATTSRFSHSLGSMHLASRFLLASTTNTDPGLRQEIENGIASIVDEVAGRIVDTQTAAEQLDDGNLLAWRLGKSANKGHLILIEQALRLAALFHDLGHLPLSHDFEFGLEQYWSVLSPEERSKSVLRFFFRQELGRAKLHERIGHDLALLLLQDLFADLQDSREGQAVRLVFELADQILNALETPNPSPSERVLQWLHSLIDGDLDVDRCDYILRDARNHGFEFAEYDVSRLLDNLLVAEDEGNLVTSIRPHGVSAVESFFLARYRSYQYGVRHHKVAQIGAATRHSVVEILRAWADLGLDQFRQDLATVSDPESVDPDQRESILRRFSEYDDVWWLSTARLVLRQGGGDEWIELITRRAKGPRSLWKRIGEFPRKPIREWNARLPLPDNFDAEVAWATSVEDLRGKGVLVMRHYFRPWRPRSAGDVPHSKFSIADKGRLVALTEVSPLVKSLWEAWLEDIQVQAFARSSSHLSADDVIGALENSFLEGGS